MRGPTFDPDTFVADCLDAVRADQPALAVRDVLERALAAPSAIADVLARDQAGLEPLYTSPELTVVSLVWAPGMRLYPHNHNMWAVIGVYGGTEDNEFFRRDGDRLRPSGVSTVDERDVLLMGDDVVHAVHNPRSSFAGAIHVYGGDFFNRPRSEWDPETLSGEVPYDMEHTRRVFAEANAHLGGVLGTFDDT